MAWADAEAVGDGEGTEAQAVGADRDADPPGLGANGSAARRSWTGGTSSSPEADLAQLARGRAVRRRSASVRWAPSAAQPADSRNRRSAGRPHWRARRLPHVRRPLLRSAGPRTAGVTRGPCRRCAGSTVRTSSSRQVDGSRSGSEAGARAAAPTTTSWPLDVSDGHPGAGAGRSGGAITARSQERSMRSASGGGGSPRLVAGGQPAAALHGGEPAGVDQPGGAHEDVGHAGILAGGVAARPARWSS